MNKLFKLIIIFLVLLINILISHNIYAQTDTDNDGMPDNWENLYGFNINLNDSSFDFDNDGLTNLQEFILKTEPTVYDTDNDGLSDYNELLFYTVSQEFQVNTYIASDQSMPNVVGNGSSYLATWHSFDSQDGWGYGIFGQLFDSDGNKVGDEFQLNTYTNANQINPAAGSNGSSYFVTWASWVSDNQNCWGYDIFGQLFDSDGNKVGDEFQVYTDISAAHFNLAVGSNGSSYFVICISNGQDGSGYGIFGQLFDADGNKVGDEFQLNTYSNNNQENPSIASNRSSYFVTWESDGQDGSGDGVFGQLFDSSGNKVGNEFQVNTYSNNDQKNPSIASNRSSYFVTWESDGQDGSGDGVFGQLFDSSGNKVGNEFQVNTYSNNDQKNPSVACNASFYFVTWESDGQDGSGGGIFGQMFDSDGNKVGDEFQLNTYTNLSQVSPNIAANCLSYLITWESEGQDNSDYGVFGKIFNFLDPIIGDTDNDGLNDGEEVHDYYTSPTISDTDNDGLNDGEEVHDYYTSPTISDTDNDGLNDGEEVHDYYTSPTISDTDNDGMNDEWEVFTGLNPLINDADNDNDNDSLKNLYEYLNNADPFLPDTDNDGLNDYEEVNNYNTSPLLADTDNDGLNDIEEINNHNTSPLLADTDNDGLNDIEEINNHNTSPLLADTDNDGMPDGWELNNDLNPLFNDADNDFDNDSLSNINEYLHNSYANNPDTDKDELNDAEEINTYSTSVLLFDTDNDGMSDGWEVFSGLNPLSNDADDDPDNDSITNIEEYFYRSDPFLIDTDNDTLTDAEEINDYTTSPILVDTDNDALTDPEEINNYGTSPILFDTDNDGMPDGWEISFGFNPFFNDAGNDSDSDLLENLEEYFYNTDPLLSDTDNDGLSDYYELKNYYFGDEVQINTYTNFSQSSPKIASNSSSYFVIWETEVEDASYPDTEIFGQMLDIYGNKIGDEIQINTFTDSKQIWPAIANNGDSYFATWGSDGQDGSSYGIFGQLFDSSGNKVGAEFLINTYTYALQSNPCIASNGSSYFVTWDSYGQEAYISVFGQKFDLSGNKVGAEFLISPPATEYLTFDQCSTIVSNGNSYFVAWPIQGRHLFDSDKFYGQCYNASGNAIGEIFLISPASSWRYPLGLSASSFSYFATWVVSSHIYGQLIDIYGNKIGDNFQISTYTDSGQGSPRAASNGSSYLLTWESEGQDGSEQGIFGQLIDIYGNKIGDEIQINTFTNARQGSPSVASNGLSYLVTWESEGQDGSDNGIFGKTILFTDPLNPDSDNDGLTDGEEIVIYNSNPSKIDTDEDGQSDKNEVIAGTNLTDSSSCFNITDLSVFSLGAGSYSTIIEWSSVPDKFYNIYIKYLTEDDFIMIEENYLSHGDETYYIDEDNDTGSTEYKLYKICVQE